MQKHEVVAGRICNLPDKDKIDPALAERCHSIENGCFGHPVVILHVGGGEGTGTDEVMFLIIRSFNGKGLDKRVRKPSLRRKYLPIHPSPAHAEASNVTLYLSPQNAQMPRRSWINAADPQTADWRILQPYWARGRQVCLTKASRADLLQYMVDCNFGPIPSPVGTMSTIRMSKQERERERSLTPLLSKMDMEMESESAAASLGLLLPTPPPSPTPTRTPGRDLPTYANVYNITSSSRVTQNTPPPNLSQSTQTISYPHTPQPPSPSRYVPFTTPSPLPTSRAAPYPPQKRLQSHVVSFHPMPMPGAYPEPTSTATRTIRGDTQPVRATRYDQPSYYYNYGTSYDSESLLSTTRMTRAPTRSRARSQQSLGGNPRAFICWFFFFLLLVATGMCWYWSWYW
ncbi:hypothetical protein FOPE_01360 [Fonsecaea pedrosoi]|nr:hypothetical protein FOPE_01360 [Fonsecaea pedrosoi]